MIVVIEGWIDGVFKGGSVEGLPSEVEERLIAQGVAKRIDAADVESSLSSSADARDAAAAAKEPTKAELQERCRALGISDRGSKAQLLQRIAEAEQASGDAPDAEAETEDGDEEPPALEAEVPR